MSNEKFLSGYYTILLDYDFHENMRQLVKWKTWLFSRVCRDGNGNPIIEVDSFSHQDNHAVIIGFSLLGSAENEFEEKRKQEGLIDAQ